MFKLLSSSSSSFCCWASKADIFCCSACSAAERAENCCARGCKWPIGALFGTPVAEPVIDWAMTSPPQAAIVLARAITRRGERIDYSVKFEEQKAIGHACGCDYRGS